MNKGSLISTMIKLKQLKKYFAKSSELQNVRLQKKTQSKDMKQVLTKRGYYRQECFSKLYNRGY